MGAATYEQFSFLGGEVSQAFQGRVDRPDYRTFLNVCLNAFPTEQGQWVRRPGSRLCAPTRGGVAGRVVSFDFKQAAPYLMEFTAGYLRFFSGPSLVMTNDQQAVSSISAANPAKVLTGTHGWSSGNQVKFNSLGANNPLLHNRVFTITVTSATEFTLADAITGAAIDGATLGAFVSGNVTRVYEIQTPYTDSLWSSLRAIQADIPTTNATTPGAVLLQASIKPYVLKVSTQPTSTAYATFSLDAAVFKDGPYFDPVPGGTLATPSAKVGNITLTVSFNAYASTTSYSTGDYVTYSSVNYKSLQDANVNHQPDISASYWVAVSAADAIGPSGFQGTDVGRHVRLYSEPAIWASGTTYAAGDVVAYGGAGLAYTAATYWKSLVGSNTGNVPGVDLTKWALFPSGAIWTWGRITALSNIIDRALAGSASIGDMSSGGGLAAAFDGIISQVASASAEKTSASLGAGSQSLTSYVGKNYSGASDQRIAQAVVYPSSDNGFFFGTPGSSSSVTLTSVTINLRGKASAPASSSDGTLLGTTGAIGNTTSPITIVSTDQTTAWKYVWVEATSVLTIASTGGGGSPSATITNAVGELSLFNPSGTGTSQGVTVQIVGDPLLYTTAVRTWRLGLYSDTTGWPTCGTYHEGRLWLSGVIANRIDSSKSNDIFNFAPTNADGSVGASNGIAYTFNAPNVNPIFWMEPDDNGIVCGTQAGEWLVRATNQNLPLTPTTIQAHRVTKYNCANVLPAKTNLTLAVVQAFKRELLEYFPDVYSGRFSAYDLAHTAKHIVATGIQEVAYQQELVPIVWSRLGDGSLAGVTYGRQSLVSSKEPDAHGWHRHELGSERTVESIAVTGNTDGTLDTLAMVTNDAASGIRHVEMLTNVFVETDDLADVWLLDDALSPTATSTSDVTPSPLGGLTLYGLWPLEGEEVTVSAGGLDCGEFTVASGQVTIPYGDGISAGTASGRFTAAFAAGLSTSQIVVGYTYDSDGQIVRPSAPAESGARNGPAFGKLRRNHWYFLHAVNSAGISIGTSFSNLYPVLFRGATGTAMTVGQTFSGITRDTIKDDYGLDGMVCWRVSRPLPAIVAAIGGAVHTQDM